MYVFPKKNYFQFCQCKEMLLLSEIMNFPVYCYQFNPEATVAEALRIIRERVHDATPGKSKKNEHTIFLFPFSHLVQAGFIRSFEFLKKF